jgi:hypothetical protein
VSLPFLNWTLEINENPGFIKEMNISYSLMILTQTVGNYRGINVKSDDKGSSIITLAMQGPNKSQNGRIFECHRQDAYKKGSWMVRTNLLPIR